MNVNPGDFAVSTCEKYGNLGRLCFVEGPGEYHVMMGVLQWAWVVRLLSPARDGTTGEPLRLGSRVWGADKHLKRVDPPPEGVETETKLEVQA